MGKKSTDSAIRNNSLCYFVNDRDGNIHQAFKLNRWGYHAGTSKWPKLWGSVSDELVGIETQGAGKLSEVHEGIYKAYFTDTNKGDLPFYEDEVRHITTTKDNLTRGTFHKFTEAQEKGLVELLLWLKRNNPEVFNFDLVLGHDEVAGKEMLGYQRKVDPSGSLSMTMPEFREYLKKEYKNRYGES
jgi:N-acetyl-anhydromuramyl-L-alanine amidase AmpD